MALNFKRTRLDAAQQRTFPNSKEEVIFRNDVSNNNLLKNPFRTSGIPVGPVGVQNRPINPMVDNRGAMYGGSVSVLRKGISNSNLLHNPYRFKTDPIDDPRTLTRQVINDINSGKAPQYIRENKGIDEIAFMIVKSLSDNGVKLATLSMLKSYITGMRLQSVLDQGGQNVTKAFDVLNQLVVTSKSLYKTGMLGMKLPGLLLQYSENIAKIFGDAVLQPVSPILMFTAIQDLASVSSVLTKLFRSQNSVSTPTNVSIDEWAKAEAAKIQALNQQAQQTPPPTPQINVEGDNHPTGTEGIKDPNNIKQEGAGRMSKKKKISKVGGGLSVNWGIANPNNASLIEKPSSSVTPLPVSNFPPPPNIVNVMPVKDPVSVKIVDTGKSSIPYDTIIAGIGTAISAAGLIYSINLNTEATRNANQREADKENLRLAIASNYLTLQRKYKAVFDKFWSDNESTLNPGSLSKSGFDSADITEILIETNIDRRLLKLLNKIIEYQNLGKPLTAAYGFFDDSSDSEAGNRERRRDEQREEQRRDLEDPAFERRGDEEEETPSQRAAAARARWASRSGQSASGRKRKSLKSKTNKTKKSKNLDAQILELLRS